MVYHKIILISILLAGFSLFGGTNDRSTAEITKHSKTSIAWTAGWSNDDRFVAIGNDRGELAIYETKGWKKLKSWNYKATTITRVEWNPKYPILAVAATSYEGKPSIIQLFDIAKNKIIRTLPDTLYGRSLSWSPDGKEIAYVGTQGRISLYSKDGPLRKTLSFTNRGSLLDIDWHPTKNLLLGVEDDIYLIDIDRDSLLATFDDGSKNKGILCCQWHPSGGFFVTGDYGHEIEGGEPSYLRFWDMKGPLLKQVKESKFEYRNIKWTREGDYLAAAADVLLVFNEKGEVISRTRLGKDNLWGVAWNRKGKKIITSDQAGTIRVTDLHGNVLKTFSQ